MIPFTLVPRSLILFLLTTISTAIVNCASLSAQQTGVADGEEFPAELVDLVPHSGNPVFAGTGRNTWDRLIRERGYVLREKDKWHLWYTGYNTKRTDKKLLGYVHRSSALDERPR